MGILVILWNILKVFIFIILFVVLLILIIMALVLFSPICYQVTGSYEQCVNGKFDVKWILGAIHAYGVYDKDKLQFSLRLFGYCIYGADKKQKKNEKSVEYTQEDVVISARSRQEEQQQKNENEENIKRFDARTYGCVDRRVGGMCQRRLYIRMFGYVFHLYAG